MSLGDGRRALAGRVHPHLVLGVNVDAETYLVLVEVVDGIKVLEEEVAQNDEVSDVEGQLVLVDDEEARVLPSLEQVLFWVELEDVVAKLEPKRLNFLHNLLAGLFDVAEGVCAPTFELGHILLPLGCQLIEHGLGDRELGRPSINDSWEILGLGDLIVAIAYSLALKGPSLQVVWKVLEGLESLSSSFDLG